MSAAPSLVVDVVHRAKDAKGRKVGHRGLIHHRSPESVARFGGLEWASWAQRTVDGHPAGGPERFETYPDEDAARKHAAYAAYAATVE